MEPNYKLASVLLAPGSLLPRRRGRQHGGVAAGARREGAHGRPELVRDAPQNRLQLRDRGHHDDGLLEEDLAAGRVRHHEGHWQDAI